jgi:hypothetical protein
MSPSADIYSNTGKNIAILTTSEADTNTPPTSTIIILPPVRPSIFFDSIHNLKKIFILLYSDINNYLYSFVLLLYQDGHIGVSTPSNNVPNNNKKARGYFKRNSLIKVISILG